MKSTRYEFQPKPMDRPPADRVLIHTGTIRSSDLWWAEHSRCWVHVFPIHIGQPVSMMADPIARLKEGA